jgi:inorganic pyrophosphatase
MANNKTPNQKQPGEKDPGTYHFNPGNQSGKTVEITKPESKRKNNLDRIKSRKKQAQKALVHVQAIRQKYADADFIIIDCEPSTKAEDGDPVDVLVIHDAKTYPGVVLRCKPIGVLEVAQKSNGKAERNDRLFALPDRSPFEGDLQDIRNPPSRAVEDLEQFFTATDAFEKKELKFLGSAGPNCPPRE